MVGLSSLLVPCTVKPCEWLSYAGLFSPFSLSLTLTMWAWWHRLFSVCFPPHKAVSMVSQFLLLLLLLFSLWHQPCEHGGTGYVFSPLLYKPWAWWCSLLHQPCEHGGTGCVFVFSPTQTMSMVVQSPTQTVFVSMVAQAVFLSYTYLVSMVL